MLASGYSVLDRIVMGLVLSALLAALATLAFVAIRRSGRRGHR